MTAPVIRQFVGTIPDRGQSQTAFDTNVDAFIDWQALQFAPDLVAFGTFASDTAAALVAALDSPAFTGTPTAPTAAAATNTTQIATTAYTRTAIADVLNAAGSAPLYACRAWVNFDAVGIFTIQDSGNVANVTDLGVGQFVINFNTSMGNATYAAVSMAGLNAFRTVGMIYQSSSSLTIQVRDEDGNFADSNFISVAIFS